MKDAKKKRVKLDAFHRHEALDRAWILASNVGEWLAEHPYVEAKPKFKQLAEAAIDSLYQLYQQIGNEDLKK